MNTPVKKKKAGRPKVAIDYEKVKFLASKGLYNKQIAPVLGISYPSFQQRLSVEPELKQALEEGKELGIANVTLKLYEKVEEGNLQAMMFFLKYRGHWVKDDSLKVSGNNNQLLVINGKPLNEYSKDELLAITKMEPKELNYSSDCETDEEEIEQL